MGKVEKIILFRIVLTGFLLLTSIFTDIFKAIEMPMYITAKENNGKKYIA